MYTGKMKILLLLFVNLVFAIDNNTLTNICVIPINNNEYGISSKLTTFDTLFEGIIKNTPQILNKHKANHKELASLFDENDETYKWIRSWSVEKSIEQRENKVSSRSNNGYDKNSHLNQVTAKSFSVSMSKSLHGLKLSPNSITTEEKWSRYVLDNSMEKQNDDDKDTYLGNDMSTKYHKITRISRHLLLDDTRDKIYDDTEDDYSGDDEDVHCKDLKKDKINWADFQTEDGPSIMELVFLNERHKKNKRKNTGNEDFYWK